LDLEPDCRPMGERDRLIPSGDGVETNTGLPVNPVVGFIAFAAWRCRPARVPQPSGGQA
jgi:hypothetical protein